MGDHEPLYLGCHFCRDVVGFVGEWVWVVHRSERADEVEVRFRSDVKGAWHFSRQTAQVADISRDESQPRNRQVRVRRGLVVDTRCKLSII
jgi:hypothetical protein